MTKLLTCNCGSCEFWGPLNYKSEKARMCLCPGGDPTYAEASHLCRWWQPSFASRVLAEILYRKHLAKYLLHKSPEELGVDPDDPEAVEKWIARDVQKMLKALKKPLDLKDFPAGGAGSIHIREAR